MPKALCMTGIVISILVLLLFFFDLLFGLIPGITWLAPFKFADWLMDTAFIICAAGLGYLSWATLKEQD